jgi:LPXTG-motif cell wall-anchored protein
MTAFIDQILVGLSIASAIAFFLFRRQKKKRSGDAGCNAGCGQ